MQINQTFDWLRYIQDNSDTVQRDVKLLGPLVDTDGTTEIYFQMSNGGSGRGRKPAHY
jgi:hypothetical protein